jgi:hypothetical protein
MKFNIYKSKKLVEILDAPEIWSAITIADGKHGPSFDVEGEGLLVKVEEHMTSFSSFRPVDLDLTQENNSDINFSINIDTNQSVLQLGRFCIKLSDEQTQKLFQVFYNKKPGVIYAV